MGATPIHQLLASALETISHQQEAHVACRAVLEARPPSARVSELMATLGINRAEAEAALGMDAGVAW